LIGRDVDAFVDFAVGAFAEFLDLVVLVEAG
jgi:hypothetical protein